jgi:hypothetical protein
MTDALIVVIGGLVGPAVAFAAHAIGQYAARAHDRKYFPPAVLLRGKVGK